MSKLGNIVRSLETPPPYIGIRELIIRLSQKGQSVFSTVLENKAIQEINDEYQYWDKVKYKVPVAVKGELEPSEFWQIVKYSRTLNQKTLTLAGHSFHFTQTDGLYSLLHHFDLHLGGTLGGQAQLDPAEQHKFLIGSIMEESIASSQIEGAVTTRVVAKEMLRKNRSPRNTSERMILNNYLTIKHIVANKQESLTLDSLLAVHRLITADTLDDETDGGQLRSTNNIQVVDATNGEIIHTPPHHERLPQFVHELCQLFNDESPAFFLHPVVKASIIHFLIGYFHPFVDGNGRTARALFYWYLLRKGYWLTEYLSISRVIMQSRTQYYRAFQYVENDQNDVTYFVYYQATTLKKAYEELTRYIDRKTLERKQRASLLKLGGLSERQTEILQLVRDESTIALTVKEIQIRFGVSNQTARTDLEKLASAGFLSVVKINQKEQRFLKSDDFDRLIHPANEQ